MSIGMLRTMAIAAICLSGATTVIAGERVRHPPAAEDAAASPYKANRLSSPRASQPIADIPGQTTVITRDVLDDTKATSLRDALRSTAGVTIGR